MAQCNVPCSSFYKRATRETIVEDIPSGSEDEISDAEEQIDNSDDDISSVSENGK